MTDDTRAKLAEGLSALVRAAMGGDPEIITNSGAPFHPMLEVWAMWPHNTDSPPPLTTLQLLGLALLVGEPGNSGLVCLAVDAMVEAGLIPGDQVEMVRADERERIRDERRKRFEETERLRNQIPCPVPGFD